LTMSLINQEEVVMLIDARIRKIEKKIGAVGRLPKNERIQWVEFDLDIDEQQRKIQIESKRAKLLKRLRVRYGNFQENEILWYIMPQINKPAHVGEYKETDYDERR
jgi:hypothetical protein